VGWHLAAPGGELGLMSLDFLALPGTITIGDALKSC